MRITQLSHMNVVLKKRRRRHYEGFFFLISCIFNRICNSAPWTATINKMNKKINLFFIHFSPKLNHKRGAAFVICHKLCLIIYRSIIKFRPLPGRKQNPEPSYSNTHIIIYLILFILFYWHIKGDIKHKNKQVRIVQQQQQQR